MEHGSYKKISRSEINANELTKLDKIIANPNCSTIQASGLKTITR
ncbi:MAG: hypothetical protein R2801_02395 [Chitinophagales bacterium]